MKTCTACGEEKSLDAFHKKQTGRGGLNPACRVCANHKAKVYRNQHREQWNEYVRKWTAANPDKRRATAKRFNDAHPERQRAYQRKVYSENLKARLAKGLRSRMCEAVKLGKGAGSKGGSAVRDLGCTIPELQTYLESMFYPRPSTGELMTWENRKPDGWHIDHKRPLASFDLTDRVQFLEACHYTNLQPMWSEQNWSKGKGH